MFNKLVDESLVKKLDEKNIKTPTKVQLEVIEKIKTGKDLAVVSETGSGKTFAYLLPLIEKLDMTIKTPQILILVPTHELGGQIYREALFLGEDIGVKAGLVVGGGNIKKQIEKLKEKPQIIVATTGRLLEVVKLKKIKMHTIKTIVLDEGDRLLDKNNKDTTKAVIKTTLKDRQLLYFSATTNTAVQKELDEIMKEKENINVSETKLPETIDHYYFVSEQREKINLLRKIIRGLELKRVIVYINNPRTIKTVVEKLRYHKIDAIGVHGNDRNDVRKANMAKFRDKENCVLVASEVVGRGLDIKDVTVINLDIPKMEEYLHRGGRTSRGGSKGICITVITKTQHQYLKRIEKHFEIEIKEKKMYKGKMM